MTSPSTGTPQPLSNSCVFTICTRSYLGLANALGASMRDQHVPADYVIVVVDGDISGDVSQYGQITSAVALCGYDQAHWNLRAFKYDLVELCTSIKARCFQKLYEMGYDKVIYFDPDIIVFDDLDSVLSGLNDNDVIATPHRLADDSDMPGRGGVFNLGFLAARNSPATQRLMAWWDARLENHCLNDPLRGYFTDQKWMDHLPVLLRDGRLLVSGHPGMNVAPWNLSERALERRGTVWTAMLKGQEKSAIPLSFVHFSAFDYRALSDGHVDRKSLDATAKMRGFEDLLEVLTHYLRRGVFTDFSSHPYEFAAFSDGKPVLPGHRRIFFRLLELGHEFADPFDATGPFYGTLRRNRLLDGTGADGGRAAPDDLKAKIRRAGRVLDFFSRLGVRLLGYPRFSQMSKLLVRYFHVSNHARWLSRQRGEEIDVEYF